MPSDTSHRKISSYLAAASAASIQTTLLHPLDTVSKRLQSSQNVRFSLKNMGQFSKALTATIFTEKNSSLWHGFPAALLYRTVASTMTLGTQPLAQRYLNNICGDSIAQFSGKKYQSTVTHALSASIFGLTDVGFLPLDRWKLLRQLNNTMPFVRLVQTEKKHLFAGAAITALRNVKAYSALFGISEMINVNLSKTSENHVPTFNQRLISSCAGSVAAVLASNPSDVVKTCLQAQPKDKNAQRKLSAFNIAKNIYAQNGVRGFARGVWPRLFSIVPRLTLLKSVSEQLTPVIDEKINKVFGR